MIETIIKIRDGRPDSRYISTSYVERSNLSIRMALRRFTRLTNAYSKKLDNLKIRLCAVLRLLQFLPCASVDSGFSSRRSGITDHIWTLRELLNQA
jgi:hypothetical protein